MAATQGHLVKPGGGGTGGAQAVISGGGSSGQGLQSVLDTLNKIPDPGKIKIPNVPKVQAQPIASTQIEKTELPSWLNLQEIQQGLMTGLDLERAAEESSTKNFLQKTGFADSTLATSSMGQIGRQTQAAKAGINQQIFGMALNEAQLKQADRQRQAELDQQRRLQNVANQIAAGTFNVSSALQATQTSMNGALSAAGLATDVIMKDYYLMAQQNQAAQESLQSFLEIALQDTGSPETTTRTLGAG